MYTKTIIRKNGDIYEAFVDDIDRDVLEYYAWHVKKKQNEKIQSVLRSVFVNNKTVKIKLQYDIMKQMNKTVPKGYLIDHIDNNPLNNCRDNLRICTKTQNAKNKSNQKQSKVKYIGVKYNEQHKKYSSSVSVSFHTSQEAEDWIAKNNLNKNISIKYRKDKESKWEVCYNKSGFDTAEEAATDRDETAMIFHGEFANLNNTKFKKKKSLSPMSNLKVSYDDAGDKIWTKTIKKTDKNNEKFKYKVSVNDEDKNILEQGSWSLHKQSKKGFYIRRKYESNGFRKETKLSHEIAKATHGGLSEGYGVRYIDHNPLNNCKNNIEVYKLPLTCPKKKKRYIGVWRSADNKTYKVIVSKNFKTGEKAEDWITKNNLSKNVTVLYNKTEELRWSVVYSMSGFKSEIEAALHYNKIVILFYGKSAVLNVIESVPALKKKKLSLF